VKKNLVEIKNGGNIIRCTNGGVMMYAHWCPGGITEKVMNGMQTIGVFTGCYSLFGQWNIFRLAWMLG
jgi:hypothetical protein